jgi:hypothetical protein
MDTSGDEVIAVLNSHMDGLHILYNRYASKVAHRCFFHIAELTCCFLTGWLDEFFSAERIGHKPQPASESSSAGSCS